MSYISNEDLLTKLKRSEPCSVKNDTIDSNGIINIEFSDASKTVSFHNVTFEKPVIFQNLDVNGSFSFYNCRFTGGIRLENCKIKINTSIQSSHSVYFNNCDFGSVNLKIEGCSFESIVEIYNTKSLKTIFLFTSLFTSFKIQNATIFDIHLNENVFNQELRIESCIVESQIRHSSNSYMSLVWMNNNFKRDIFLRDNTAKGNISIQDNIFEDTVTIDPYNSVVEKSNLTIISNKFQKRFSVLYYKEIGEIVLKGGPENIYVFSNEFDDGLTISNDCLHSSLKLKILSIDITNKFEGLLKISEFYIENLKITGENYKGNIILKSLWVKNLSIINFANYSSFQFIKLQPFDLTSSLKIDESHLEKFQFTGCYLDGFAVYTIESSNLSLIKSSNTKWFNFKQLEKSSKLPESAIEEVNTKALKIMLKKADTMTYLYLRDTFRQLKYAMEQQGDKVNALTFKSYEMEAYHKYVKEEYSFLNRDRLILLLGKTNSHGINWKLPLWFILGFTLLFYIILLLAQIPRYSISGNHLMTGQFLKDCYDNKKIMVQLLNPLHKVEDVFPNKYLPVTGWTYTFDFTYKIIFSFLVFQLVSAFRKFVK